MAVIQTEENVTRREETESRLSSYQRKKGAVLLGAINMNIRSGTPIVARVVDHYIDKEVEEDVETKNEDGELEITTEKVTVQSPVYRWDFGVIKGLQPTQSGMNYQIVDEKGEEHSIIRKDVITREMFEAINYVPTPVLMYNERAELIMVTLYSWDSMYLACPFLNHAQPLLHRDFKDFIKEREVNFIVSGEDEDHVLIKEEIDGYEVEFGPYQCSLLTASDCRRCIAGLVNFAENWDVGRGIVSENCGRGTMYSDGKFIIRRHTKRPLFIRWIELDRWVNARSFEHLEGALDAIIGFHETHGFGMPELQVQNIQEKAKEKLKARDAELKDAGDEAALKEFRKHKRVLNKKLKELPILTDEQLNGPSEEGENSE
jgi:hypothetical protein